MFIPLPLAAAIGLDSGVEASMEAHTTGQTIGSVGGRDYATGEEKGEKEIAYLCQPRFFMQGFFSGIKIKDLTPILSSNVQAGKKPIRKAEKRSIRQSSQNT